MTDLKEFQRAAVDRIVERLTADPRTNSRRFLLADEVGLGKTLVAREVVARFACRNGRRNGLVVAYVCSSQEIAAQNRARLIPHDTAAGCSSGWAPEMESLKTPLRLTLLAKHLGAVARARRKKCPIVVSLTKETSLDYTKSMGLQSERQLILALLWRIRPSVVGRSRPSRAWREYFRGSAAGNRWHAALTTRAALDECLRGVPAALLARLASTWKRGFDTLEVLVDDFAQHAPLHGKKRSARVAGLRFDLASEVLKWLKPDLLVLDEFQRFKDVLTRADETPATKQPTSRAKGKPAEVRSLAPQLLGGPEPTPTLIVSATPYKWLTLEDDAQHHHSDFISTIQFLLGPGEKHSKALKQLTDHLKEFRRCVEDRGRDVVQIERLKHEIEAILLRVMCRTERNWYYPDENHGVEATGVSASAVVSPEELDDYLHLRQSLIDKDNHRVVPGGYVTHYWKAAPRVLSFLSSHYKHRRFFTPNGEVVPQAKKLVASARSHQRYGSLRRLLGIDAHDTRGRSGRTAERAARVNRLWVSPSYRLYASGCDAAEAHEKLIVFSHWRFVPRAITYLLSREVEVPLLKGLGKGNRLELNVEALKVVWPWFTLADCVKPVELRGALTDTRVTPERLLREAKATLRGWIDLQGPSCGVRRARRGERGDRTRVWEALARLEARSLGLDQFKQALSRSRRAPDRKVGIPVERRRLLQKIGKWSTKADEIALDDDALTLLARVALFSPAVNAVRTLEGVSGSMPHGRHDGLREPAGTDGQRKPTRRSSADAQRFIRLGLDGFRPYFNRTYVRAIVSRHRHARRRRRSYADAVLEYARDWHLPEVLDEFAYVLAHADHQRRVGERIDRLREALTLLPAKVSVNQRTRGGGLRSGKSHETFFAVAFGTSDDGQDMSQGRRKSVVRQAFNSPFWPFVLATTSIGQEGLDFHFYCRDIVHWNLPANPVDLEQREGRIDRFDGLHIRRAIAADVSVEQALCASEAPNLWQRAFAAVEGSASARRHHRHGLYPHWIYSSDGHQGCARVRRHVPLHADSRDGEKYERLKRYLSLYRLAFGQPDQLEMLSRLQADGNSHQLEAHMIRLSPFQQGHAWKKATRDARAIVRDAARLGWLVDDVRELMRARTTELGTVDGDVRRLVEVAERRRHETSRPASRELLDDLARLLYLADPFDDTFDRFSGVGLGDDITRLNSRGPGRRDVKAGHHEPDEGRTPRVGRHGIRATRS